MTYYDSIAEGYDELHKEEQLNKLRIINDNLKVGNSLLDVGCGTGFSLDFFDANKKVGLDPSKELLKHCKYETVCASAEKIPFADNSFDTVICVTAAHHFPDLRKCFEEIKRVGKNNFAFSLLKKSSTLESIKKIVKSLFIIEKEIDESKDVILICRK